VNRTGLIFSALWLLVSATAFAGEEIRIGDACARVMPIVETYLNPQFPKREQDPKGSGKKKQAEENPDLVARSADGRDTVELSPAARRLLEKERKEAERKRVLTQVGELLNEDLTGLSNAKIIKKCLAYAKENQEMWDSREAQQIADVKPRDGRLRDAKALLATIGIVVAE